MASSVIRPKKILNSPPDDKLFISVLHNILYQPRMGTGSSSNDDGDPKDDVMCKDGLIFYLQRSQLCRSVQFVSISLKNQAQA